MCPDMIMNVHSIKTAITPLRMIFWGGLLCIFDITLSQKTNGYGFKCDILDDTVGSLLIAVGVFRLARIRVHDRYAKLMSFLKVVAVLYGLDTIQAHFLRPVAPTVDFVLQVFGFVTSVAVIAFCVAMLWFCEVASLRRASQSWRITTILFILIYGVPLGPLYIAGAVATVANHPFHIDLGPLALLVLPIFALPLFHLFVSTSRMKRAAEFAIVSEEDDD
jgi:hypothetical protein